MGYAGVPIRNGVGHPGLELGFTLYLSKCGLLNHVDAGRKSSLTVSDLVGQFELSCGKRFVDDSLLLQCRDEG
ncbi:MAG: hypothetical protein KAH98_00255 [Dehalococcoidia bacterium]|nr:hypothetical protein [Dehalococcoidia bacterium]